MPSYASKLRGTELDDLLAFLSPRSQGAGPAVPLP
jgi:hypothetical protein